MHARRRNTVTTNLVRDVVARDRIRHGNDGAFAGGVGEAVGESRRSGNRRHVEDDAARGLHIADAGVNAVVDALHIDALHAIKILFADTLGVADVRDPGVVHQNVNASLPRDFAECRLNLLLIAHIASVCGCSPTHAGDLCGNPFGVFQTNVEDTDHRPVGSELQRNRAADAAAAASDHRRLSVQPEFVLACFPSHSETPRFHGMKSSCEFCSALVRNSPLATFTTRSRTLSPICSMVESPAMIEPVSMSMMSAMRSARVEFVDSLMTGVIGFPVGVPSPVVNRTTLAPAPTCAVTHSTSFPGVHCRFNPGAVEYSGQSRAAV